MGLSLILLQQSSISRSTIYFFGCVCVITEATPFTEILTIQFTLDTNHSETYYIVSCPLKYHYKNEK